MEWDRYAYMYMHACIATRRDERNAEGEERLGDCLARTKFLISHLISVPDLTCRPQERDAWLTYVEYGKREGLTLAYSYFDRNWTRL